MSCCGRRCLDLLFALLSQALSLIGGKSMVSSCCPPCPNQQHMLRKTAHFSCTPPVGMPSIPQLPSPHRTGPAVLLHFVHSSRLQLQHMLHVRGAVLASGGSALQLWLAGRKLRCRQPQRPGAAIMGRGGGASGPAAAALLLSITPAQRLPPMRRRSRLASWYHGSFMA